MRREAVQEERQRTRESEDNEVESTSNSHIDPHFDRLTESDTAIPTVTMNGTDMNSTQRANMPLNNMQTMGGPIRTTQPGTIQNNPLAINTSGILATIDNGVLGRVGDMKFNPVMPYRSTFSMSLARAAQNQVDSLIRWAKSIREFERINQSDQLLLLKTNWNELILIDIAYRSVPLMDRHIDGLNIWSDITISELTAGEAEIKTMYTRIKEEIVAKLRDMRVDQRELLLLKTIILFNPESPGLGYSKPIEDMRNLAFTELENHCNQHHFETQPNRFGKLLLRLPSLRSIGLKCNDHPGRKLVFVQFEENEQIEHYLSERMKNPDDLSQRT